jgi:glycosyltransferase involved in cell wall biosynthesis
MYFALTTYNRKEVLEKSLESLIKTDFPENSNLIISDDKSSPDVIDYISSMFKNPIKNLSIKLIFNNINVGCDRNMIRVIRDCFFESNDQFVITIDSDAIYNPKWIYKLLEAKESIKGPIGMLGVFNTSSHGPGEFYNDYVVKKKSMGGFVVMLNKDLFFSKSLNTLSWDWSYVDICKNSSYGIFCTKNSYADHIGHIGVHSNGSNIDRASNFIED